MSLTNQHLLVGTGVALLALGLLIAVVWRAGEQPRRGGHQ